MKGAYADNGYIHFDFDIKPIFRSLVGTKGEGVVDFEIDISEGQRFTVRRIVFEGNEHTPDQILRRALLIREGDPFSRRLYDASIRNLNQLGLFKEIDGEKDVTWASVDDGILQIDLVIHLKRTHP